MPQITGPVESSNNLGAGGIFIRIMPQISNQVKVSEHRCSGGFFMGAINRLVPRFSGIILQLARAIPHD